MNGLRKRKKLKVVNFLRLRKPFILFNFIYAGKTSSIHARTHVKFTQQWKSTFRLVLQ